MKSNTHGRARFASRAAACLSLLSVLASLAFVACAEPASVDDAPARPDAFADATCTTLPAERPAGGSCLLGATGRVTDLAGAPLSHVLVTVCGTQCFAGLSDAAGRFAVPVAAFLRTGDYAVHADGRPDHAVDYARLAPGAPSVVDVTMRLAALPPSEVRLPPDDGPAATLTQGDVTLLVPAGTAFDLDLEDYANGDLGRTFRVGAVPLADAPTHTREVSAAAVYAFAPSGAKASQKLGLRLRNAAALAPSSPVEFLVLGDDYFSQPPTVGLMRVGAHGHVSADGTTIETDPGEGISELTWLAIRIEGM